MHIPTVTALIESRADALISAALCESVIEKYGVTINAHKVGTDHVYLSWMHVPHEHRGKGIGSAAYKEWESKLPTGVKHVSLHAADSDGEGSSWPFWEKHGFTHSFDFMDQHDEVSSGGHPCYELSQKMHKGVRGTPTSPTVHAAWDADAEEVVHAVTRKPL